MKKMLFTLVSMLTIAAAANAMSYEQARNEALFLTDKMAYELNLNDAQYEAAYEINLDYLMGVTSYDNVYGPYWERRNLDLSYILYTWQWDLFRAATYFYRPLYWEAGHWHFGVYIHYPRRDYFYFGRPHFYATYRGGHSWRHNGGRSWYEGRHGYYRTVTHRDHHVGMRNSWDRGDYRNNGGRSSTRITERNGHTPDVNRRVDGNRSTNDNRELNNNRSITNNRELGGHRSTGSSRDFNNSTTTGSRDLGNSRTNIVNRDFGSNRTNTSSNRTIGNSSSNRTIGNSSNRSQSSGSFGSMSRGSSDHGTRGTTSGSSTRGGRR